MIIMNSNTLPDLPYHCDVCDKHLTHSAQLRDHLSKKQHLDNLEKQEYRKRIDDFLKTCKDGSSFMLLDLEGNIRPKKDGMILLELSYIIFSYVGNRFEMLDKYTSLVKAGLISDYPREFVPMITFTIMGKHGLPFSTCQQHGIEPEQVYQQFFEGSKKCKYILSKGMGMEKYFNTGCVLQNGFMTSPTQVPVIDLLDIEKLNIKTQNLQLYPSCGHHIRSPKGNLLHCSFSEVYCFYDQLVTFLRDQDCTNTIAESGLTTQSASNDPASL